jgi:hypothetical protein
MHLKRGKIHGGALRVWDPTTSNKLGVPNPPGTHQWHREFDLDLEEGFREFRKNQKKIEKHCMESWCVM